MTQTETKARLEEFCSSRGIHRFSAEEMVELLADGEDAGWIVEQVLPGALGPDAEELLGLLGEAAAQVGPAPAAGAAPEAEVAPSTQEDGGEGEAAPEGAPDWDQLSQMLPPGVDAGQLKQLLASPQGEMLADFGAFCQERGMNPQDQGDETQDEMRALHEEWLQTPRQSLGGRRPAEVLEGGRLLPRKVETFRREAPKVGRNDPCPCGSGKKYKKCCGQGA